MKQETFKNLSKAIGFLFMMAVLLWGSAPQPAHAAGGVIIDEFEEIADAQILNVTLATSPQQSTLDHASIIGGERDAQVVVTAGSGTMTTNTSDPAGFLNHSQPVGLRGRTILTWDGNDNNAAVLNATGLGGVNLAAPTNDAFLLGVISADLASQLQIQVYSSAANFSTATLNIPAGTSETTFPILFSSFVVSGGTGANFANVGAVVMTINSAGTPVAALDLVLDFLVAGEANNFMDFGDLPDSSYGTLTASNGPRHSTGNLFLGSAVDNDTDGAPSGTAVGDDTGDGSDDEDGVSQIGDWFNGPTGGQLSVILGGDDPTACVSGWMDFNNDGDFADPGENILDMAALPASGPNTLNFNIPASTFPPTAPGILTLNARFRVLKDVFGDAFCLSISNAGDEPDISSTGPYVNGEVEDYQFTTLDYGDLPAVYNTTNNAANGARHTIGGLYLGPTIDAELEGKQNASALGDDITDSVNDEDGVATTLPWANGVNGGSVFVTASGAGCLSGWIDWNNDGDMNDAGENPIPMTPVVAGGNVVLFNVPAGTFPAVTTLFARYRLVPDTNANGICSDETPVGLTGLVANGEVEDYLYALRDYGDLPASYNNTNMSGNGARHVVGSLFLGASVDAEFNGQESANATGDDVGGTDDENGIGFTLNVGTWGDGIGNLNVTVTGGTSCVVGWADYNGDNSFNDDINDGVGTVSERLFTTQLAAGTTAVNFPAPRSSVGGGTFVYPAAMNMRFRLFPLNDPLFTANALALTGGCPNNSNSTTLMASITVGEGSNGEVEDYRVNFTPTAVSLQTLHAAHNQPLVAALVLGMVFSLGTVVAVKRARRGTAK